MLVTKSSPRNSAPVKRSETIKSLRINHAREVFIFFSKEGKTNLRNFFSQTGQLLRISPWRTCCLHAVLVFSIRLNSCCFSHIFRKYINIYANKSTVHVCCQMQRMPLAQDVTLTGLTRWIRRDKIAVFFPLTFCGSGTQTTKVKTDL